MARKNKAAQSNATKAARAAKAAKAAKASEAPEASEVVEAAGAAEAPSEKGRKASRKDEDEPSRKKLRSSEKEEVLNKDEDGPSAEVAKLKTSTESSISPLLVFAHGAGAPSSHEWMVRWKKLLGEATGAVEVVTFDYPYCANGKKGAPPKAEKLVDSHKEEIKKAMSRHPDHPLVLVGKSMGSRVSCMVAGQEDFKVAAVVCLGYPLKGANGALRGETLLELKAPVLFVQGSKDKMFPFDDFEKVQGKMTVKSVVHVVKDGDHSLKISKKSGLSQGESDQKALSQISIFLTKALTNTL